MIDSADEAQAAIRDVIVDAQLGPVGDDDLVDVLKEEIERLEDDRPEE